MGDLSLKKSKDGVERLYADEVSKNFPNYAIFWEKYIGNPYSKSGKPYVYKYPVTMSDQEKQRIETSYLKIQMSHYTLFCHIAGAHFQLKQLESALMEKESDEQYFRSCEHYDVGYIHIGSVFYVVRKLWCTVFLPMAGLGKGKGKDELREMTSFLKDRGYTDIVTGLNTFNESILNRRHLPVHSYRVFIQWYRGKLYVPIEMCPEMVWSKAKQTIEWNRADKQLSSDLAFVEKLLNDLHSVLTSEYETFIKKNDISIDKS
jgi:hypothetical protein